MEKNLLSDIILYFQFFGTALYIFFLMWIIVGLRQLKLKSKNANQPFVSIIVAARNEEKNIGICLESLLKQNYPVDKYEIIVVDDHSEDDTSTICTSFSTGTTQR